MALQPTSTMRPTRRALAYAAGHCRRRRSVDWRTPARGQNNKGQPARAGGGGNEGLQEAARPTGHGHPAGPMRSETQCARSATAAAAARIAAPDNQLGIQGIMSSTRCHSVLRVSLPIDALRSNRGGKVQRGRGGGAGLPLGPAAPLATWRHSHSHSHSRGRAMGTPRVHLATTNSSWSGRQKGMCYSPSVTLGQAATGRPAVSNATVARWASGT